jgi:type I restriction-modification system DNA methylase subunit
MPSPTDYNEFLPAFFGLFTRRQFARRDFTEYLTRPGPQRANDEASVVDNAIVGPLLELLGFARAEQVYNRQRPNGRPDFAPEDSVFGTCFVIENKNTAESLDFDLANPDSHLSQLSRYARDTGVRTGWLTNGRQLTVWQFNDPANPRSVIDLDIPAAIGEWTAGEPPSLSEPTDRALRYLWETFRKDSFTDLQRLEREIATKQPEWAQQALPLDTEERRQLLVGAIGRLLEDLQADARRTLDNRLQRYDEYDRKRIRLADDAPDTAEQELEKARKRVLDEVERVAVTLGLEAAEKEEIEENLRRLEADPKAFAGPKGLAEEILKIVNAARARKFAGNHAAARPRTALDNELKGLGDAIDGFAKKAFTWHQRTATLRQEYRPDIDVHDHYVVWTSLVQETMLGGLNEEQRKNEFAIQAAYVVFIRLLLIRVCEDKGIFARRFVSDGGLRHWQKDIRRYLRFANGNPYDPLLDMAYRNAQNIYAHFFTGRELFNWYQLDRPRFVKALRQLGRFNFAGVDSDIVGTVYSTYVERKEKKKKGQYYTPPAIVRYILDEVGYRSGPEIIGANKKLIDPACGSGTFLVEAARRLVAAYRTVDAADPLPLIEQVRDSLYGFDLNPFACYLAEVNLLIQVLDLVKAALDRDRPPKIQRFHVYNVDSLAPAQEGYRFVHASVLMAEELDVVDRIKLRAPGTPYANGFAFVVANPPYGATLTDDYEIMLHMEYGDVFYGQPDTYVFFLKKGMDLLAKNGRLGFITPNTYLMGTNTHLLRGRLLERGRIEQITDMPQGIWPDANVDCALLFLAAEPEKESRKAQQVQVRCLDIRDKLDRLEARQWRETLTQPQSRWMDDPRHEMFIRYNDLFQRIEDACLVPTNGGTAAKVLRLGDVTDSSQGIIPYKTRADGHANLYIRDRRVVPPNVPEWNPLLDGTAYVGRYELRWGQLQPYLKYGDWLWCQREQRFFDSPKLLIQSMRNRALRRRLVATFDDRKFYNRHNFNNAIAKTNDYDLKYILALFNSSLLNYWFARRFDNVNINPDYFRQLPIFPADAQTQAEFAALVDQILAWNAELNALRAEDYTIRRKRDGSNLVAVPYDRLLAEMQQTDPAFPVLTLFQARAAGKFTLPAECDMTAQVSGNVYIAPAQPERIVLRRARLWLEVPDTDTRRYLLGLLQRPQWQGKTWAGIQNAALLPETPDAFLRFYAEEARKKARIEKLLQAVARLDAKIDERVLDLYGITDPLDRSAILGSAPVAEDAEIESENTEDEEDGSGATEDAA